MALPHASNGESTKQDCLRAAQAEQVVNLSAGVYTEKAQVTAPLHIKLPATVDDGAYFECLVKNQLIDHNAAEKYLARQDECRTRTRLLAVKSDTGTTRLGNSTNEELFVACMDANIGVEVLDSTE